MIARFLLDPRSTTCRLDKTTPVKQIKSQFAAYQGSHFYKLDFYFAQFHLIS